MLLNTSAQSNLLADIGTGGAGQDKLSSVVLDGSNLGASRGRANVDHNNLVLSELSNLGLFTIGGPHTEQAAEKVEVDLDLTVDLGKAALETQDETDQTIGSAQSRIDSGADTDETAGYGVLEVVGFGVKRDDSTENGCALEGTAIVSGDNTRSDLDLITKLDNTVENRTTGDTTFEVINLRTRLVDVE